MVSSANYNIYRLKSSRIQTTAAPGWVTGGKVHELTNMDLAMKLHYIKGVYFFNRDAVEGLTLFEFRNLMITQWHPIYVATSGRIRIARTGRPFITCNDAGVRIVEERRDETIDEWLAMVVGQDDSTFDGLVHNQALGDHSDLGFSPLVFIQLTWFKCGGMSVGLSWAHVLGDAFSASTFINFWGKAMAGPVPHKSLHVPNTAKSEFSFPLLPKLAPNALKRIDSVGDLWLTPNNNKMNKHTFHVPEEKINHFLSDEKSNKVSAFEVIAALIWKSMSKIKENPEETRMVSLCVNKSHKRDFKFPSNGMVWSTVEADFWVAEAEVSELVELILNKREDENDKIEEMMGASVSGERTESSSDFIAYGAQLTFVNLEEMDIYGLELKGQKPIYANYTIDGVGDEGVVLVLPGPKFGEEDAGVHGDRYVNVVLPDNQLAKLKVELERSLRIA